MMIWFSLHIFTSDFSHKPNAPPRRLYHTSEVLLHTSQELFTADSPPFSKPDEEPEKIGETSDSAFCFFWLIAYFLSWWTLKEIKGALLSPGMFRIQQNWWRIFFETCPEHFFNHGISDNVLKIWHLNQVRVTLHYISTCLFCLFLSLYICLYRCVL